VAQFFEAETTRASYDVLEVGAAAGLPQSLYVDRTASTGVRGWERGRTIGGPSAADAVWPGHGAIGRGVDLGQQSASQGRVERMNGVLQDRLVKALRLEGISELGRANEYLAQRFLPALNRRSNGRRQSGRCASGVPRDLDEVLSWEEARWCSGTGRWCAADVGTRWNESMSLESGGQESGGADAADGRVQLVHRARNCAGEPCRNGHRESWCRQSPRTACRVKPRPNPWRQLGFGVGREYWRGVKARGRAQRAADRLAARDPVGLRYAPAPASLAASRGTDQSTTT